MLSISMHLQNLDKFRQFFFKILSGNKIPTSIKAHNAVISLGKLNQDLVHINAYAKFGQFHQFVPMILSGNEIRSIKGHNSVINL